MDGGDDAASTEVAAAAAAAVADSIAEADSEGTDDPGVTLIAKFGKERITLARLDGRCTTIGAVKNLLREKTGVLPKRQKLIGLTLKKKASGSSVIADNVLLDDLKVKPASKKLDPNASAVHQFILMGTPEERIFVDPSHRDDLPDVVDDFDLDFNAGSDEWIQHVANDENLKRFTASTQVHIMSQPRPGKPLLVLDLDHTLLDFSSKSLRQDSSTHQVGAGAAAVMKRPFMDEFLTNAYKYYDLVVWSQTSWRWLETKLTELGMLIHPGYRFCFVLDKTSMFTITSTRRNGTSIKHHVKPLQIIWSKFPQWGSHNTVHIDDLSRNFALNLGSGLKISAYYRKKSSGKRDVALQALSQYLEELAKSGVDFDDVNFAYWQDVVAGKSSLKPKEAAS